MENLKVGAIIQARYSSSRLPGKVLIDMSGECSLDAIVDRLRLVKNISKIIIATSKEPSDDIIENHCKKKSYLCERGSLDDVLDRFYKISQKYNFKNILRITGDCPLIDYQTVEKIIKTHLDEGYDYYGLKGRFPDGLDCTCFSQSALEKSYNNADLPSQREHIGQYIEKNSKEFKCGGIEIFQDYRNIRLTLDEKEDLNLLQTIFKRKNKFKDFFDTKEILEYVNKKKLNNINSHIKRNEGLKFSLEKEKKQ